MSTKRILLVEDDEHFSSVLKMVLEKEGHEVTVAGDGKSAQRTIEVSPLFDLVISDINMPQMNGIDLLKWIKSTKPIPVLLMTGFSEILKTQEAYELGADEFLPKPFDPDDLFEAVNRLVHRANAAQPENIDKQFCHIAIDDFMNGKAIGYGIFIRLSAGKYAKIANLGEDISVDRIRALKAKKLRFLCLKKDDYRNYIESTLKFERFLKRKHSLVDPDRKLKFLRQTREVLQKIIPIDQVDAEEYAQAETYIETVMSLLVENEDVLDILEHLYSHADYLFSHSLGVAVYSVMIAREMNWRSTLTLAKLSLGALFHDVGKKDIARKILDKREADRSQADVDEMKEHPKWGRKIVEQSIGASEEVVQIVFQHHENMTGSGFPNQLKKGAIHPLAKVVAVADVFCNIVLPGPAQKTTRVKEAIQLMVDTQRNSLDPIPFAALIKLLQHNPEEYLDNVA